MKTLLLTLMFFTTLVAFAQSPEEQLTQLNMQLPEVPAAGGSFVDAVRVGNLIYLSGKGPRTSNGEYIKGKLGQDLTVEQGYEAARLVALLQLAVLKKELGDLKRVKRIVKVNGYVNSAATFYDQPKVINGYSDVMIAVFGDMGKHARTAVGTNALPFNMAVEVEMIVEVAD
ncbi:RidA family protein [Pontibacter sp. HSC-14F20]|uniref:RidA family protein n=1 Tax=Pontibacter sp. HSC-14F20 TaxID=2864136 RepID=UPI001C734347|nr:RidA family protein [Pontibacter sp. HSC-14F20]MBX0331965.1 RidA family protein [Pontibacter sp. HSC-14F20]